MKDVTTPADPVKIDLRADWREQLVQGASLSIKVAVHGFWSRDAITIYVQPSWSDAEFTVKISGSSGGRDTDEVARDVEAALYYAQAMTKAADLAAQIEAQLPQIGAEFLARRQAERAAAKAKVDADQPMGEEQAALEINRVILEQAVKYFYRGQDSGITVSCKVKSGRKSFFVGGCAYSRKEVIAKLAGMSKRFELV